MFIRKSTYADLPRLMEIYRQGRQRQLDSGNLHQWKEGYPSEDVIRRDIDEGISYAIEDDGEVVGAFALIYGEDPTYKIIYEGSWTDDSKPYATIHRLAGLKSSKGVAKACFDWCWEQIRNLRVDTHEENARMRHCIENAGFKYCGIILLANGDPRLAFQKID